MGIVAVSSSHRGIGYLDEVPTSSFRSVILRLFPSLDGLKFIQIGANDGKRFDPINALVIQHRWEGILVEPVPDLFRCLKETYKCYPKLQLVEAAVDLDKGTRSIYRLDKDSLKTLPDWAKGLATFDLKQLEKTALRLGIKVSSIIEEKVVTIGWPDLWARLSGKRCDVLVLDTEGYDIALLRVANLKQYRPRVVHFEHALINLQERSAFYSELLELGYKLATDENDTTAWLTE